MPEEEAEEELEESITCPILKEERALPNVLPEEDGLEELAEVAEPVVLAVVPEEPVVDAEPMV